jgi:cytochrome P450
MGALLSPDGGKDFMDAFQAALRDVVIPNPSQRSEEHFKGCQEVWDYIDARIDEAVARTARSDDEPLTTKQQVRIIDELVKSSDDKTTLRFLVISLFMPAHDNLAVAIGNVFFHLARKPEAWTKLRAEVISKADQPLNHEVLTSHKYLTWVLKESKS